MRKHATATLLGILFFVQSMPTASASSWSPTLLVNTESFQSIDDGDGTTNIELRFGTTSETMQWNVTSEQFEFTDNVEIQGTASGKVIHAQDLLTSSGGLVVEGTSTFNSNAIFNSTITLNGVTYNFPAGDGSASGKVLATDGAGNLSWTDTSQTFTLTGDSGTPQTIENGETLDIEGGTSISTVVGATDKVTIDITDDSVNFTELANSLSLDEATTITLGTNNFIFDATSSGRFEIIGTASGRILHAQDQLTSSGTLRVAGIVTFANTKSCANLKTDANGVLSCNNTDYIEETELDDMSELETQVGSVNIITSTEIDSESELESLLSDVTNVLTNNDDTDDLSEGSTHLYFTDERVDDRVSNLLKAGTGVSIVYDDGVGTLTIAASSGSGNMVSLSPEYDGATYYADGGDNVGQLVLQYDSTNKENYYKWNSTKATLQDYTIAVRIKIPENFSHWQATPIEFRYRTNAASADDNKVTMTMLDTAGSSVSLTGGANLVNTSWTTASITGPQSSGTFTAGQYITLLIQMFARTTNTGEAHAGYINLNWATTHP